MLEKSLEFYKTLLFCNILARRTRITRIELKQEINSVHQKLDAILSKIGQCPASCDCIRSGNWMSGRIFASGGRNEGL